MNSILSKIEQKRLTGNNVDTDYRAEVIAAGLLEKGVPADQVCIFRKSDAERGFSKDVADIRIEYFTQDTEYLAIYTNRQGFYDNLPEGLFHKSSGLPFRKSKAEILKEIEFHRTEERNAREFFRPLEVAINSALVDIQLVERKIDKKQTNRNFVNMFGTLWPILKLLPLNRAILCMEIISILADSTPTLYFATEVMTLLLDIPVTVRTRKSIPTKLDKEHLRPLSKMKLGIDMILGNTFDDGIENIDIRLGPMSDERIRYYSKTQEGCDILEYLTTMLLPADRTFRVIFLPIKEEKRWVISNDRKKASLLGINSFINNKRIEQDESRKQ